jgi:hypothetical protein
MGLYKESQKAGNKHKSYQITRMNIFTAEDKVKPHTENIRGLNLAAVKLITKLLL